MVEVISRLSLRKYLCYLGFYGHDLLKGTHLLSTLPTLTDVENRATAAAVQKHRDRIEKKNQRLVMSGKEIPEYYKRDANGKFHGCKDLATSAVYPLRFVRKVYFLWRKHHLSQKEG